MDGCTDWAAGDLLSMPPPPDCLANSLISKPALNLELAPVTTMALTSGEECASRRRSKSALSTASQANKFCSGHNPDDSMDLHRER